MKYFKKVEPFNEFLIYCKDNGLVESKKTLNKKDLKNVINECVDRCLKKYLKENISNRYSINEQEDNG